MSALARWLLVSTLLLVWNLALHAAVFNIAPSADTYFETYGSETKNFGTEPILRMDQWGGRQVFIRFPLTDLPPQKQILKAKLRLYIIETGFNEQGEFPELKTCLGIYDVATPWTELGLSYNSPDGQKPWNQGAGIAEPKYADVGPLPKPDIGVHLRIHAIPLSPEQLTNGAWLELDLTEYIRERVRAGDKEVNLVLRSSILGRNYSFRGREANEVEQRPALVVHVDDQLPTLALDRVFITDWKPATPVNVGLRSSQPLSKMSIDSDWSVVQEPLITNSNPAQIAPNSNGATLSATAPGKYQVQLTVSSRQSADGKDLSPATKTKETTTAYLLSVPPHPRLYVTPERLERLREDAKNGSRLSKAFLNWVSNGSKGAPKGKFHDMEMHEGAENTALAWLLTGDRQYLSNSIAYAQQVLRKPMREHFEDVHAATFLGASWVHAMALHYDWCFDQLPLEHRQAVAQWLKEAARWGRARSGAPIAHNDGGARQCLLGSAALALLGDDPEAEELYRASHENFETNLLPWLNDGGKGGRSGDGGEYEGLHAFYIVKYAWMAQTATGEDVFSESPFFFNRLQHVLFGWYPRRLIDRTGTFSMRQYYSPSGDHIRMGYVGDTQPYQSAAVLCARFADTPEAQAVRWLGGEWPTQWMQYTLRWAVLGEWERIPAQEPMKLAYVDTGCNTVYTRSDWSDNATWVLFENPPYVSAHDSLDSGSFEIFKGDLLAARTGNLDYANVGAPHTMNYLHRTIAGNCLLIEDPEEKWKGFLGGAEGDQDGGGQRTNFPLSSSPDADSYQIYREIFQRGHITRYRDQSPFTYAMADLTDAYNSPRFHGGKLNRPKTRQVSREMVYLRDVDTVLVFDRVNSLQPAFKKTWLLHSLGELDVLDGSATQVSDGEFRYEGATRAVIRYGWPKPVPSFGRCLSVTLLPEQARLTKIGGRVDLPPGKTEAFPGDKWHGQHRHHHVKDFWVNGTNYPPGEPPETRWFGDPTSPDYVPGTPDETGGRGKWRLEVSPATPASDDVFFHVLCPRLGYEGSFPTVEKLPNTALDKSSSFAGALIVDGQKRAAVFFSRGDQFQNNFRCRLPVGQTCELLVTGLNAGSYEVRSPGHSPQTISVGDDGVAFLPETSGDLEILPSR